LDSPLFALATGGLGQSALAVVRLSGLGCRDRLCQLIVDSSRVASRSLVLRNFVCPQTSQVIDEVMVVFFDQGKSFTGEGSAEIHCHGSTIVVEKISEALRSVGFRDALPGEFSERAFRNGKMSLSEAEGLASLIASETELQYQAARVILNGHLEVALSELRSKLVSATALLEAVIDFPDEKDVDGLSLEPAVKTVREVREALRKLIDSYQTGRVADSGLRVCLVGYPNAGKSTLFNSLLGSSRAIVSPVAGTTRDYIEERIVFSGHLIRLVDTAGLREVQDGVESVGVELSLRMAAESDVVVFMCSSQSSWSKEEQSFFAKVRQSVSGHASFVCVQSQVDLMENKGSKGSKWSDAPKENWLGLSTKTGEGVEQLKLMIVEKMKKTRQDFAAERVVLLKKRHVSLASEALTHIDHFLSFTEKYAGKGEELLAAELQMASRVLASIIGKVENDEVLESIFRQFCIGK
jgi:tRNA modification GTPase